MKVCSLIGEEWIHSVETFLLLKLIVLRELLKASQMIHINMITAENEIKDPIDEMIFQEVNASG